MIKKLILAALLLNGYLFAEESKIEVNPFESVSDGSSPFKVYLDPNRNAYFPEGREAYYTESYHAAKLPSFQSFKLKKGEIRFRVGYFRSFSKTLILSYERKERGAFISIYRTRKTDSLKDDAEGIELKGEVRITDEQAKLMEGAAIRPEVRDPFRELKGDQRLIYEGLDGETWVLEVVDEKGYTMADIWCPELFKHHDLQIRELPEFKNIPKVDMLWFERFCKDLLKLADMEIPIGNPKNVHPLIEPIVEDDE